MPGPIVACGVGAHESLVFRANPHILHRSQLGCAQRDARRRCESPSKANIHVDELLRAEKQFRNQKSQRNNAGFTYECTKFVAKMMECDEKRIIGLQKERIRHDGQHQ